MLAGIYLGGNAVGRQSMDVHRHATFSCSMRNFFRWMVNLFRR